MSEMQSEELIQDMMNIYWKSQVTPITKLADIPMQKREMRGNKLKEFLSAHQFTP